MGKRAIRTTSKAETLVEAIVYIIREITTARTRIHLAKNGVSDLSGFDIVNKTGYRLDIDIVGNKIVIDEELR